MMKRTSITVKGWLVQILGMLSEIIIYAFCVMKTAECFLRFSVPALIMILFATLNIVVDSSNYISLMLDACWDVAALLAEEKERYIVFPYCIRGFTILVLAFFSSFGENLVYDLLLGFLMLFHIALVFLLESDDLILIYNEPAKRDVSNGASASDLREAFKEQKLEEDGAGSITKG